MPAISVVIPTLGRNDALSRTPSHLERQSLDRAEFAGGLPARI